MTMIFTRWIMAADRMGPFWDGFAARSVDDLAHVLDLCEEPLLADELRTQGPRVLCGLDVDRRYELAAKVEPTLKPGVKQLLQKEAVEMERHVGTDVPLRLVVLGRAPAGETVPAIMGQEFPNQRGTAISLLRPTPAALISLNAPEAARHQLIWPEPPPERPSPAGPQKKVTRLPLRPNAPMAPSGIWDLKKLACLNFPRHLFYSQFASQGFVGVEPGRIVHYGGLRLVGFLGDAGPETVADVLFGSGLSAVSDSVPVAFLSAKEGGSHESSHSASDRAWFFLGEARQEYARIDFDPMARSAAVSVHRTRDRSVIARTTLRLHKDRLIAQGLDRLRSGVIQSLAEDIGTGLPGPNKVKRAERQADQAVGIAQPMAARYLEWLEWRPEAPVAEREEKLIDLEGALTEEIRTVPAGKERDLLRRDLYQAFKGFLLGWGLGEPA